MAKKEIEVISLLSSSEDDEEKSVFNVEVSLKFKPI